MTKGLAAADKHTPTQGQEGTKCTTLLNKSLKRSLIM